MCLAIFGQGEGRMLLALSLCGPAHPKQRFQHLLYLWAPFGTELLTAGVAVLGLCHRF